MSQRSIAPLTRTTIPAPMRAPARVLQRTCDCGKHAMGGECESCKRKKLLQRSTHFASSSSGIGASSHQTGRTASGSLVIGKSDDAYEREADRIAGTILGTASTTDRVMSGPVAANSVQRTAEVPSAPAYAPPIVDEVLRTRGQGLDRSTRAFMEPRFGTDFSKVQLHTDAQAANSARSVNAAAYTVGNHVVFGSGFYAPGTARGDGILAHELTHVIQQGKAPSQSPGNGPAHEQEARGAAAAMARPNASIRVHHAAAPSLAPMSVAEARHSLWSHVPDSVKPYVRPIAKEAAAQMDRVVPPNTEVPKAVEAVVVHPLESAKAAVDDSKHAISAAGDKLAAGAASVSQTTSKISKVVKQKAKEKAREAATGGLGFTKGVVLEVTNAVDALAWVPQAGHDLAEKTLGDSTAAKALIYATDSISGYAALQALTQAGLSDIDPLTGKPTNRFSLSVSVGAAFDRTNEKVEGAFGDLPKEKYLVFSTYESEELAATAVVQIGLSFVEVEEVQLVLKVLGILGSIESFVKAIQADLNGWYKNRQFWFALLELVLSAVNLRGNIAKKIAGIAFASGQLLRVVPAIWNLYDHYKMEKGPERDKKLHDDLRGVANLLAHIVADIVRHSTRPQAGAGAPESEEGGKPKPAAAAKPKPLEDEAKPTAVPEAAKPKAIAEPTPKPKEATPRPSPRPEVEAHPAAKTAAKATHEVEPKPHQEAPAKSDTPQGAPARLKKTVGKPELDEPAAKAAAGKEELPVKPIRPEEALAQESTGGDHKAVVTRKGVGGCSPGPCPLIHVEYAKELQQFPTLKAWNKRIQGMRKRQPAQAAKEGASLIKYLNIIRKSQADRAQGIPEPPAPAPSGLPAGAYTGSRRLARGNFGERAGTEALAADGHKILSYKPDIAGTNQGGIDMVTVKSGVVHFVDNKALTRGGNVSSVSALTRNFAKNRAAVVQEFTQYANDPSRPAAERAIFRQAVQNIQQGKYVRVVTNANVTKDTEILSGVTQDLRSKGIGFIDVMR